MERIEACRAVLDTRSTPSPPTSNLYHLISIILTNSNFVCQHFHGPAGTETTSISPISSTCLVVLYRRCLCHLDAQYAQLQSFLHHLNDSHPSIKFTADWSPRTIHFLDVTVTLEDGLIKTDLYQKPTDTHQYLLWDSCHPHHNKTSIPFSQALRLRRICSQEHTFRQRTSELLAHLQRRGYPKQQVTATINRAAARSRDDCLQF